MICSQSLNAQWIKQGLDLDGKINNAQAGFSISLSANDGSTLAIGAPYDGDGGPQSGYVRVFKYTGGVWIQKRFRY